MKYVLVVIVGICLIATGIAVGQHTPRFEHVITQTVDTPYATLYLNVLHDRDTGQEIVCVDHESCYLTGRRW